MDLINGVILDPQSGYGLSAEYCRVAEIIKDYDPTLELAWIPPNERMNYDRDLPFAIVHRPPGREPYIVKKLKDSEVNANILAEIFLLDNQNASVLDRLDAQESARAIMKAKEEMERAEERQDFATSVLKSPLHSYKHNGVRFD